MLRRHSLLTERVFVNLVIVYSKERLSHMPDRSTSAKKGGVPATLDLMGEDETPKAKPAPRPRSAAATAPAPSAGVALFDGDDVDLNAKHPADVPVGNYPAPSQIAPLPDEADDPFAEEDPFAAPVMARMLADEPTPTVKT
jgi:hypothetical protein